MPILIVEKPQIMARVEDMWANDSKKVLTGSQRNLVKKEDKNKELYRVLLKRPLTKEELLVREMQKDSENDVELELEKNYFYVLNPEGKVIDCAKIYTFLHENNIYQRIIAKVAQDLD